RFLRFVRGGYVPGRGLGATPTGRPASPPRLRNEQVMPGGQPVVCDCGVTGLGKASGRVFSPAQDLRFYSSRLAMRAVRRSFAAPRVPARRGRPPTRTG